MTKLQFYIISDIIILSTKCTVKTINLQLKGEKEMIHRTILWVVLPLTTTTVFGLLMGPVLDPKWSLLLCVMILGGIAIEAAIENAAMPTRTGTTKPTIVGNVIGWAITLPLTRFIAFTIGNVNSDINIIVYALMIIGSLLAMAVICLYVKHMWRDIKYFEIEEDDDDED